MQSGQTTGEKAGCQCYSYNICRYNNPEHAQIDKAMKFSEEINEGSNVIHSYQEREITINGHSFYQSLIISQHQLLTDWPINEISQLSQDHLMSFLDYSPEVILIGTGDRLIFPHPETYSPITNKGIGVEFMDTGAACRTYNILMSENRRVIAGMIINV